MNLELSMIPKSGVISTNFEEIKEKLETEMSTYKTMRVTVDNKKEAKEDMADLRKLKKKLNDRKNEVKEEYMKPYLEVEDGVKQLISVIDGAINFLDGQVAELEEQRVLERKAEITKVYDEFVEEELLDYMPMERIWNNKWTNASTTMKSIREDITGYATNVRTDIATINAMQSDKTEQALNYYMETNDLASSIQMITRYEQEKANILKKKEREEKERREKELEKERERVREEERRRIQEEEEIKAEAARKAISQVKTVDEEKAAELATENSKTVVFTVKATDEELEEIEMALTSLGVYFERKDV
jgi:hypothetical protein